VAAVLFFGLMSACGDDNKTVTAGDEPSGEVAQPNCADERDPYNYTADPDHVGAQQAALRGDQEIVLRYGEAHPDDFTQVAFENHPTVKVLGVFTDHLDEHRAALETQHKDPEKFEVRQGTVTARDEKAIQQALDDAPFAHQWNTNGFGGLDGHVSANFFSTREGRNAAEAAHARWGRVICITIADHPYPKGAWADPSECPADPVPTDRNAALKFTLVFDKTKLHRGEQGTGTAQITNNSATTITVESGSSLGANVTRPGSNDIVGGAVGGFSDLMGRSIRAAPGETVDVPIRFGTDDCAPNSDYSLPAGDYVVSSYLKEFGRSDDVTITIVE
jgi:hypothetical protein